MEKCIKRKNLCNILGKKVNKRRACISAINELEAALPQEWRNITVEEGRNLQRTCPEDVRQL
ncbi:hypothetical protein BX666DRAFT_1986543 [Dichotomocladium elegans]|nr:hypothetical protein BX666DRAFT_1986543 [Dichotomocladium elegans]